MFNWICPQCGRECPPSYTECPDCTGKTKPQEPTAEAAKPAPASETQQIEPPRQDLPAQGSPAVRPVRRSPGLPAWMVTAFVAITLMAVVGGAYWWISRGRQFEATAASPATRFEAPTAGGRSASAHPYSKHLELTGFRITEDSRRKPQIRFIVVNHSAGDIASTPMQVILRTSRANPEDPPLATLKLKLPDLGAYGYAELTAPLDTNLRAYELPDWQFLRADIELQ